VREGRVCDHHGSWFDRSGDLVLNLLLVLAGVLPARGRDDRGATAAEYGLLVGLVVLVLVFGVDAFKLALALFYGGLQGDVDGWVP
jgi:pilus assembly protein Flp/PilA